MLDCGGHQAALIQRLFNDSPATAVFLEFLQKTKVSKMKSQLLMEAGEDDDDEEEEIELWPEEQEDGSVISEESEEEVGPGPPS